jgi:hypothetical protein
LAGGVFHNTSEPCRLTQKAAWLEKHADGSGGTKPDAGPAWLSKRDSRRKPAALPFGDGQAALQPPLPLQLFLPLQPISPVVQPPLPLQLFMPLQSCFSTAPAEALAPELSVEFLQPVEAMVPASNPAMAAEMTNVLAVLDIVFSFQFCRLIHE